jgi:MFS transporter, PPP family, 3-phenylpropionic acid transporter
VYRDTGALVRVAGPEAELLSSSEQRDHGERLLQALPALSLLATSALGAIGPYLAVTLGHAGIEGSLVALLMGVAPLFRLLFGPAAGWIADRFHAETRVLRAATGMAALGALGVALAAPTPLGRAAGIAGTIVLSIGRVAILPAIDGAILKALGPRSARYGRVRSWGSLGYLAAAVVAPLVVPSGNPIVLGVLLSVLLFVATCVLPRLPAGKPVAVGPALRALGASRATRWLLLGAALHYAPIGTYDLYFAVYVRELGLPLWATGVAIGLGVGVEVLVLWLGEPLLRRFAPETLLRFAVLLGIPRWLGTALLPWPWMIVGLQVVHGVSFGAFWIAVVALLAKRAPSAIQTSAQTLLSAAVGGLGALLAAAGGGLVLAHAGGRTMFLADALVAVLAALAVWRVPKGDYSQSRTNP